MSKDRWVQTPHDTYSPRCPGTNREFHDENRKPIHKWYAPLHQDHEDKPVNNRQHGEKWDHEGSLQMAVECSQKQGNHRKCTPSESHPGFTDVILYNLLVKSKISDPLSSDLTAFTRLAAGFPACHCRLTAW